MEKEIKPGIRAGLSQHLKENKVMAFTVTDETAKRMNAGQCRERNLIFKRKGCDN